MALDPATVSDTLGVLLKYQDDIARIEGTQGEGTARRRCMRSCGRRSSASCSTTSPQSGRLAENIVYFARALRAAGIPVGPGAVLDALDAVQAAGVGTREDFYWTLHAVFVKRHEHSVLFDQAFRMFFRKRAYLDKLLAMLSPQAPAAAPEPPQAGAQPRAGGAVLRHERQASRRRSARSSSTRASPCPTARCCRRRTSRR